MFTVFGLVSRRKYAYILPNTVQNLEEMTMFGTMYAFLRRFISPNTVNTVNTVPTSIFVMCMLLNFFWNKIYLV